MEVGGNREALLSRLLSASSLRAKVLADNIANQNTPGYQRQVVRFEEMLAKEIEAGHDVSHVQPFVETDRVSPAGPDGNNVSLELETNAMRENWARFQAYATILQSHFDLMKAAITERA
jgi:flagellar basal-body rod protein FlgB